MFTDIVRITIKSGDGGNGVVSFHTEKYVSRGGPDGGDGGRGGHIYFRADASLTTLNAFYYKKHFFAENGSNGAAKLCYGKRGEDLYISVPVGTSIRDVQTGKLMADLVEDGQTALIMKGGEGGKGNAKYATATRRAPRFCSHGVKTEKKVVELELKSIADVGLVGFPNVGKSTLLSVISAARPKIADYHFTTLYANLGVVSFRGKSFVCADIPGLIEKASEGQGLGLRFLRHIERTRMIVHVVDMGGSEGRDPVKDFEIINRELKAYSEKLAEKVQIVAANKMDMPDADKNLDIFRKAYPDCTVVPVMAAIRENIDALLEKIIETLDALPPVQYEAFEPYEYEDRDTTDFEITRDDDGAFVVMGGLIDNLARKVVLDDYDSLRFLQRTLNKQGVIAALREKGAKEGSTVRMGDIEFEFID